VLAVLVLGTAAAGCARNAPVEVSPGAEFELGIGETARMADGDLMITFERVVEDSRCPVDVVCVRAGRATVRLATRSGEGDPLPLELSTGEGPDAAASGPFTIRLVSIAPPRRARDPGEPGPYRATLLVERE
jgi:hypothetical protein